MKSAPAIVFDCRPSRWIAAAILAVMVLGFAAVAVSGVPFWSKFVLVCSACGYGAYALRAFLRATARRAAWYDAGHWRIAEKDGVEHLAELQGGIVRGSWIVLHLRRSDGEPIAIILGPDNSDVELRRRLRVRLARAREDVR